LVILLVLEGGFGKGNGNDGMANIATWEPTGAPITRRPITPRPTYPPTQVPTLLALREIDIVTTYDIIFPNGTTLQIPWSQLSLDLIASMDQLAPKVLANITVAGGGSSNSRTTRSTVTRIRRRHLASAAATIQLPTTIESLIEIGMDSPCAQESCS
jgi:hypothetical protein